jgi:ubiquinone/menaquinone biosynthesis C-methylase UbiE
MEPYLPHLLRAIGNKGGAILEVGCGQGIDAIEICRSLAAGSYTGIDLSQVSVDRANEIKDILSPSLASKPNFMVGNAENLSFRDDSFDLIWSMGVIHHTPNINNALSEIKRVLRPQGIAYIMVYRKYSLKVGVAKILRGIQGIFDALFLSERLFYKMLRKKSAYTNKYGTMFLECFGVPIMNAYTKKELFNLIGGWNILSIESYGSGFGSIPQGEGRAKFGYFWLITLEKT